MLHDTLDENVLPVNFSKLMLVVNVLTYPFAVCSIGKPVLDVSGELVCTKPFLSMLSHFWNDQDGVKYKRAYFSKYTGRYGQEHSSGTHV